MNRWKDVLGIVASVVCAIHCALTPVLLAFLPTLRLTGWMASPYFHQSVAVVCVGLVAISIWPAFQRNKNYQALGFSSLGLMLVSTAAFLLPDHCCTDTSHSDTTEITQANKKHYFCSCASGTCVFHSHESTDVNSLPDKEEFVPSSTNDHADQTHVFASSNQNNHSDHQHEWLSDHDHEHAHQDDHAATWWSVIQPWMTPIGGLFLVLAHAINMRASFGCSKNCRCSQKHVPVAIVASSQIADESRAA